MRGRLVPVAALLLVAGCSGSSPSVKDRTESNGAAQKTLHALANAPGPDVAVVAGTSDFGVGPIRYTFLVVAPNGASIERPRARVWLARALDSRPFARATAILKRVGVPGSQTNEDVKNLYVAHFRIRKPGTYWILAEPVSRSIQALGNLVVRQRSFSPAIGSEAYPSQTPTLSSTHGDLAELTTRVPPDRALLRYSIANSLAEHKPFVVVFATPKFCTSRTCGPVVDVVNDVRRNFPRIRFIHVEIYKDNDPTKGFNRWVKQWHLPTEPWVFLVGRDGRIKAKFEGSVSGRELTAAIKRELPD